MTEVYYGHSKENGSNYDSFANEMYYMLQKIDVIPDGWERTQLMTFYFDINTHIVYAGTRNLDSNSSFVYELKSAEYRNYVYDIDKNEFIGVN